MSANNETDGVIMIESDEDSIDFDYLDKIRSGSKKRAISNLPCPNNAKIYKTNDGTGKTSPMSQPIERVIEIESDTDDSEDKSCELVFPIDS